MALILYSFIVFLATSLGAMTGAGGGAIIKPVFDLIGLDNATTISIYSTIAVFSMCLSSLYKHGKSGLAFNKKIMLLLALGSLFGGYLGDLIFKRVTLSIDNSKVTMTQAIMLFIVLLLVLLFTHYQEHFPKLTIRNSKAIVIFGLLVGALSVFLGIGGGPLNVIVLLGLMSFSAKESTAYSIAMIFFAQIPKLYKILFTSQAGAYNPALIPLLVLAAILGGYFGTRINHLFTDRQVTSMYSLMMLGLLLTCLVNIVTNI